MSIDIPSNCWKVVKLNILQRDIILNDMSVNVTKVEKILRWYMVKS